MFTSYLPSLPLGIALILMMCGFMIVYEVWQPTKKGKIKSKISAAVSDKPIPDKPISKKKQLLLNDVSPRQKAPICRTTPFLNLIREADSSLEVNSKTKLNRIATYRLHDSAICVTIIQGNIVDFKGKDAAIVNSTNTGMLGGFGVDQAISEAGGSALRTARKNVVPVDHENKIRCMEGHCKILGPNSFGEIDTPFVIMAVCPVFKGDTEMSDEQFNQKMFDLRQVHQRCLDAAGEKELKQVVFPLISCGRFKGGQSVETVVRMSLLSIIQWTGFDDTLDSSVTDIIFCAATWKEAATLGTIADEVFEGCLKTSVAGNGFV